MTQLQRRLGVGHAVGIGLASMVGAGVFFVWAPAAQAAGAWMLLSLAIAALVATLNALSSAQLAMAHPVSGGAYAFARATVGEWTGFTAGWLFLAGKTASAGAIALIAGSYLWPEAARSVAVAAVAVFALVNASGIRSTALVSGIIVTIVLVGLAVLLITAGLGAPAEPTLERLATSPFGVLQAAALIFFAFAGYARMATLGEEVVEPRRTLPRAIIAALAIALIVYALVGVSCLLLLGPERLAASASPLAELAQGPGEIAVRALATLACLGSLVGILAGLSRTSLAMARGRDLPGPLGYVWPVTSAPVVAEATVALLAVAGILLLEPRDLVAFSSCSVLVYYLIAHLSAYRQPDAERWLPRALQLAGVVGCAVLAVTLPWTAVVGSAAVLLLGLLLRALRLSATRAG